MAERRDREVAFDLMRMTLPLLDRAGDAVAAARLQGAIDCVLLDELKHVRPPAIAEDDRIWSIVVPLPKGPAKS